jgi:hypothetical protein
MRILKSSLCHATCVENHWPSCCLPQHQQSDNQPLAEKGDTPSTLYPWRPSSFPRVRSTRCCGTGCYHCPRYHRACRRVRRVSTRKQADAGNLQRQKERLVTHAVEQRYQVVAVLIEIGSFSERAPSPTAQGVAKETPSARRTSSWWITST